METHRNLDSIGILLTWPAIYGLASLKARIKEKIFSLFNCKFFLCPSELCYVRYKALNINTNTKATLEKKVFFEVWEKREGDRQKKFDRKFMAQVDN